MGRVATSSREDEKQKTRGRYREGSVEKNRLTVYDGKYHNGKDHKRMWRRCKTREWATLRDGDGDVYRERKKRDRDERVEETRIMTKNRGDTRPNVTNKVEKPEENAGTDISANSWRSEGFYVPPHKLARTKNDIHVESSIEYQRMAWDAMGKILMGSFNGVTAANLKIIIPKFFALNLIRGRGLFCRSCLGCQMVCPRLTDVFAGLIAVVNAKFPEVGDLLLRRIVLQLQRAIELNDNSQILAPVKFIAHLVNQQVAHELIALELVTLLLEKPTYENVKVAVGCLSECGSVLQDLSPQQFDDIFEQLRGILHGGNILVQFSIEQLFELRGAKFQGYPAIRPELDLVEQKDQVTHKISLLDEIDPEIALDTFAPNAQFSENENVSE